MVGTAEVIQSSYIPIDAYPDIAQARLHGRREAYEILETNRQDLLAGEFEAVNIPVDALGTAKKVKSAEACCGRYSTERQELFSGLVLDCKRLYSEATRINTWEYFPPLLQAFEDHGQEYYSHGQPILNLTANGLSPVAEPEERDCRIGEHVEEITYKTIRTLGRLTLGETVSVEPVRVRTISECADWAIKKYKNQPKDQPRGSFGGYAPQIEKFMVRDVLIDLFSSDRFEEQMGLPGEYITHDIITETLEEEGLEQGEVTKTERRGQQIKVNDDLMEFVAHLDRVASRHWGIEIYLGEILPEGAQRDYEHVREKAIERQKALDDKAYDLAEFAMALVDDMTDRWAAEGLIEAEVKRVMIDMADEDNSLAADMFDIKTEQGLQEVAFLRSIGQIAEADLRLSEVSARAPSPGYCGAGSCDLEAIRLGSQDAEDMKKIGLDPKNALRDTVRKCKGCGDKKVTYDLKNKKKGCLGCGATAKY